MQRRTAATAATLAGLVLTGSLAIGVAPGYAATPHAAPVAAKAARAGKAPKGDGSKALCRRVPRLERRLDRAVRRLEAGAGTRGSIARLQERVDNANSAGHAAVAKFLGDRLTHRKSLLPNLEQRQTDIKSVADWCLTTRNGIPSGASASSAPSAS